MNLEYSTQEENLIGYFTFLLSLLSTTNSIKALKEPQSTDSSYLASYFLDITGLLWEEALISDVSIQYI